MGKIGQLVANGGMWNGEQIVSSHWIDEMTTEKIFDALTEFSKDMAFCYLWWKDIARGAFFTMGHGGQFIIVNKDKNLTIVITSEQYPAFEHGLLPNDAVEIYDRINNITK